MFSCSDDHEQGWQQLHPVDPYSSESADQTINSSIHACIDLIERIEFSHYAQSKNSKFQPEVKR